MKLIFQQRFKLLGRMMFHECSARPTAFNRETVTGVFGSRVLVSRGDEGNDQVLDGV